MAINWVRIYNRLFEIINSEGDAYFSGPRFIAKVKKVDPYFPDYTKYMALRRSGRDNTSRKSYFYDILLSFEEPARLKILNLILDEVQPVFSEKIAELRNELGGISAVPTAQITPEAWNAERLNKYLSEIDIRIDTGNYEGAVTLAYTCLEGFLKVFVKEKVPNYPGREEIIKLSRAACDFLRGAIDKYPGEAFNTLTQIAHTVDRSRNRFSESHFDEEAGRWLAVFIRDLVNSEIRLLLHFL